MKIFKIFTIKLLLTIVTSSIFQYVSAQKADTALMNRWYDSMVSVMETEPETAIKFVHKGIEESNKGKDLLWEGYFLQSGGIIHDLANHLDSGLHYFEKTIEVAKQLKDTVMEANALGNIGVAYQARGYLQPALTYQLAAARLRESQPKKMYLSKSLNNIGLLYRMKKDYKKALEYLHKSLNIKTEVGDSEGIATALLNIGSCYQHLGNYDSALTYANKTLAMSTQINDKDNIAAATANIGIAQLALGNLENAIGHLKKAIYLNENGAKEEEYFSIYQGISSYYEKKGNLTLSKQYAFTGLQKAKQFSRREQIVIFQNSLAKLYAKEKNFEKAFQLIQQATLLRDSLLNEASSRQINEMNILYETELKESRIETLTSETSENKIQIEQGNKQRNLLLTALAFSLFIALIIGYSLKQNQKKNALLSEQKNIIEKQLKEKEILMGEIHHRVKNNLQIISGLLNLQSRHIADPNALQAVREGRNRVKSIALIHQQLYQRDSLTAINLNHYLKDLLYSIQQSFRDTGKEIKHELICPETEIDVEVSVPIGLIINELVTNCYKHAFTGKESGKIIVSITQVEQTMIITTSDNGVGLPQGFVWQNQKSFGIKMIGTLVSKLKATFEIEKNNGTTFIIKIPNYANIT